MTGPKEQASSRTVQLQTTSILQTSLELTEDDTQGTRCSPVRRMHARARAHIEEAPQRCAAGGMRYQETAGMRGRKEADGAMHAITALHAYTHHRHAWRTGDMYVCW